MNPVLRIADVGSSFAASVFRLGSGMTVGPLGPRPEQPLEVYEFEACPFCRKVREAITMLDLAVRVFPCPRRGTRFRPTVVKRGGKEQFPYLVDPNTGEEMYESDDIDEYLYRTYGDGPVPLGLKLGLVTTLSSALATAVRPALGLGRVKSRAPEKPLELWSFEASPFCRIVREALCSLELPYLLHNVGKKSPSREAFVARSGKMMVPYLADPNTDREMFESADIVSYLYDTYAA